VIVCLEQSQLLEPLQKDQKYLVLLAFGNQIQPFYISCEEYS
jgi:hypothetical protein